MLTLYKFWRREFPLLKAFAIAALLTYTTLNYVNVDAVIARKNVNRYFTTGKIDLDYLRKLSYDAIPELRRLGAADSEDVAGQKIATFLHDKGTELRPESSWQSYNYSKAKAKRILSGINP